MFIVTSRLAASDFWAAFALHAATAAVPIQDAVNGIRDGVTPARHDGSCRKSFENPARAVPTALFIFDRPHVVLHREQQRSSAVAFQRGRTRCNERSLQRSSFLASQQLMPKPRHKQPLAETRLLGLIPSASRQRRCHRPRRFRRLRRPARRQAARSAAPQPVEAPVGSAPRHRVPRCLWSCREKGSTLQHSRQARRPLHQVAPRPSARRRFPRPTGDRRTLPRSMAFRRADADGG
jgi:hypothetical protein